MRRGMMAMSVRDGRALVYYNASRADGLWFVEIEEVNVDGVAIDDALITGEEEALRKYITHELEKEAVYGC